MAKIKEFEDLKCWQEARGLVKILYKLIDGTKLSRDFELSKQMKRAGISIMSNIAEGFERDGNKEFNNFLTIAKASAGELKSQLYIALDVDYITNEQFELISSKVKAVSNLIGGLIRYLKQSELKGSKFYEDEEFYSIYNNENLNSQ